MKITVKNMTAGYGTSEILHNINLEISSGEKIFIGGANGSGKTTLLRVIAGIIPHKGEVLIDGSDVSSMRRKEVAKLISLMPQTNEVYFPYTVYETVLLGTYASSGNSFFGNNAAAAAYAAKCIEDCDLTELKDRHLDELSGGQLQRACICRSMINKPRMIFADEPTGALNRNSSDEVMEELTKLNNEGTTVMLVTHDAKVAAKCSRVLFIVDGNINGEYNINRKLPLRDRERGLNNWLLEMGW